MLGQSTRTPLGAREEISIRRYFRGKHVLLTGCTGLVGKVVVEKILRCLPECGSISLLIRPKTSFASGLLDARMRFHQEVLAQPLFNKLRVLYSAGLDSLLAEKLHFIDGDLLQDHFGLDASSWTALCERIDVVIHAAATVNLHERLDLAIAMNVDAPLRILAMARSANATLVQISTAYVSGCRDGRVPERLVDTKEALAHNNSAETELDIAEEVARLKQLCEEIKATARSSTQSACKPKDDPDLREWVHKELVRVGVKRARSLGWMDTYTYTKFLGEHTLARHRGSVPIVIVRPSIIESILREPEPGWLQDYRMADPVIVSFAKGRLFDFPGRADAPLDLIPVDLVANCILASAAYLDDRRALEVVHIATSNRNPMTLALLHSVKKKFFTEHPLSQRNGAPISVPDWQYLPLDEFLKRYEAQTGRAVKNELQRVERGEIRTKASIREAKRAWIEYEKMTSMADHYGPYTTMHCRFDDQRAASILEKLPSDEREEFNFDPCQFTWEDYLARVHLPGIKHHLLGLER